MLSVHIIPISKWFALFVSMTYAVGFLSKFLFSTYSKLDADKRAYWRSSIVSTIHAILVTWLSFVALYDVDHSKALKDMYIKSEETTQCLEIFVGYILSDFVHALYFRSRWAGWKENLIHHTMALVTWGIFLEFGVCHQAACVAHLCEITTPFANQRWFFAEAGMSGGKLYFYNGMIFALLWFLARVLMYPCSGIFIIYYFNDLLRIGTVPAVAVVFSFLGGAFLQIFWFNKIIRGAMKAMAKQKQK